MILSACQFQRPREAAVVNLGSNAVANTLPAGGALAMGVSWAMLSSWGISTAEYVPLHRASNWSVRAGAGLGLLVLATASLELAIHPAAAVGAGLARRQGSRARPRTQRGPAASVAGAQPPAAMACRVARPAGVLRRPRITARLPRPGRASIAARGWRITAATAASNLTLWLSSCWPACAARPVRGPGFLAGLPRRFRRSSGLRPRAARHPRRSGHHRLGLIAAPAGAVPGQRAGEQQPYASYWAVTPPPPIPLGAIACLTWQHAPALIHAKPAGPA